MKPIEAANSGHAARRLLAGLACLAILPTSVPHTPVAAAAGSVAGEVLLLTKSTRRLATPGAYPNRTVTLAPRDGASEVENVIVFARSAATAAPRPSSSVIRQKDEEFRPHVLAVTTGSSVEFSNDDPFFHNVFSLSKAATFDLGRYPRGQSRVRTFNTHGIVKLYCHIHSHMSALVRVFDHPYFARPDRNGHFELAGLLPGRYEIVAWHERVGEQMRMVTVDAARTAYVAYSLPMEGE